MDGVGAEQRLKLAVQDLVAHFTERLKVLDNRAMVVCMSQHICIDPYRELVRLRPDWYGVCALRGNTVNLDSSRISYVCPRDRFTPIALGTCRSQFH